MTVSSARMESAIAQFYEHAIRMQKACSDQMKELVQTLESEDKALLGEKKEQLDLLLQVSKQIKDTFADTATKLAELEKVNSQGKVDDLRNLINLNFLLKERDFKLVHDQMAVIQEENKGLIAQNQTLRKQYAKVVTKFAKTMAQTAKHSVFDSWRITQPGLNLEGKCDTSTCEAYSKRVVVPIHGPGPFDLKKIVWNASCPSCNKDISSINRFFFESCTYSLSMVTKENEPIEKTVKVLDITSENASNWMKGKITVKINEDEDDE